jgi:molecular chaperone GrpE
VTPAERDRPSEAAVRDQLREEPGPRASSAPAEGREPDRGDGAVAPSGAVRHEASSEDSSDDAQAAGGPAAFEADAAPSEGPPARERPEPAAEGPAPDEPAAAAPPAPEAPNAEAEPASTASAEPPSAEAEPSDPLGEAQRQRDEYLALAQRTQADFENFRRRAARDAAAAGARAKAGLVRELLPVLDNLERALDAAGEGADEGLAQGVKMVHSELVAALERNGVAAFVPTGEPFDPTFHEAISTRPADGSEPGVVLEVVEKGYRLEDAVLRPARVVVSA